MAQYTDPPLTTVHQPIHAQGRGGRPAPARRARRSGTTAAASTVDSRCASSSGAHASPAERRDRRGRRCARPGPEARTDDPSDRTGPESRRRSTPRHGPRSEQSHRRRRTDGQETTQRPVVGLTVVIAPAAAAEGRRPPRARRQRRRRARRLPRHRPPRQRRRRWRRRSSIWADDKRAAAIKPLADAVGDRQRRHGQGRGDRHRHHDRSSRPPARRATRRTSSSGRMTSSATSSRTARSTRSRCLDTSRLRPAGDQGHDLRRPAVRRAVLGREHRADPQHGPGARLPGDDGGPASRPASSWSRTRRPPRSWPSRSARRATRITSIRCSRRVAARSSALTATGDPDPKQRDRRLAGVHRRRPEALRPSARRASAPSSARSTTRTPSRCSPAARPPFLVSGPWAIADIEKAGVKYDICADPAVRGRQAGRRRSSASTASTSPARARTRRSPRSSSRARPDRRTSRSACTRPSRAARR